LAETTLGEFPADCIMPAPRESFRITVTFIHPIGVYTTSMTVQPFVVASWLTPPASAKRPDPLELPSNDEAAVDKLAEHFNHESFSLPVREGEEKKEVLSEREMMFLVSTTASASIGS
jgi:hypothetical protein